MDPVGWTTRGRQMANIGKIQNAKREGKWMWRVEEEEESTQRKIVKYLKTLERAETKKESEETQ